MVEIAPVFQRHNFEDNVTLKKLESIFLNKRGIVFKMPKQTESVVLLLSGGMDSVLLWYLLLEKYKLNVYPLCLTQKGRLFDPQRSSIRFYSTYFNKNYPNLFHQPRFFFDQSILSLKKILTADQVKNDLSLITQNLYINKLNKIYRVGLINTPTRLTRYASAAYEYALLLSFKQKININTVFFGIVQDDAKNLRESTLTVLRSINLVFCLVLGDFRWQFTGALEKKVGFCFTKMQLLQFASKTHFPVEKTWSCDRQIFFHCGTCPSCLLRKTAYIKSQINDKTIYLPKILINAVRLIMNKDLSLKKNTPTNKKNFLLKNDLTKVNFNTAPGISLHRNGNATFVFNKETGVIESLNTTGSFVFQQLIDDGPLPFNNLFLIFKKKYHFNQTQIKSDLVSFLKKAVMKGYIILK